MKSNQTRLFEGKVFVSWPLRLRRKRINVEVGKRINTKTKVIYVNWHTMMKMSFGGKTNCKCMKENFYRFPYLKTPGNMI